MNKTAIITMLALLVALAIAIACTEDDSIRDGEAVPQTRSGAAYTLDDLLDAMEWVESKGDVNAIGDGGNAVGCLQIWKIYVDDVNRINRLNWDSREWSASIKWEYYSRTKRSISRKMAKTYMEYYASAERLGREPTFEDMARIHNGGPNGYKKECTEKVQ